MSAFLALEQSALALKLTSISIRELIGLQNSPADIYGLENGLYTQLIFKNDKIGIEKIKNFLVKGYHVLYVFEPDRQSIKSIQQSNLRQVTRSLSIGDPIKQAKSHFNLLTINMGYLYEDPTNDEVLQLQYQSIKNLAPFLMNNTHLHGKLYSEFIKLKHHFIFAQPLISSLFLIGVLKNARHFTDKEIEAFFVTSYFKDIGMSAIPTEKYNEAELSDEDKVLLADHNISSVNILKGRIPLTANLLTIIENHHLFSSLTNDLEFFMSSSGEDIFGMETVMIATTDIIAAMISDRPYRESTSLFESLDFIKTLIGDEYPEEFRLFVTYFKSFFKNSNS